MSILVPCKNCTKKYLGCHAECADYALFVEENNKIKAARQAHSCYCALREAKVKTLSGIFKK